MKILLIGEYSRLHNSLKEGLQKNGHKVTLLGSGDGFKNYPVDIKIDSIFFNLKLFKLFAKLIDRLFKISLNELEMYYKANKIISDLKGYDVVQLINENAFRTLPSLEILLIKTLMKNNEKLFLEKYGNELSAQHHHLIRDVESCYLSSSLAVSLAKKYDSDLHVFHLTTEKEMELFTKGDVDGKKITSEVCVHHMHFNEGDYAELGNQIKCNPSIKEESDRLALIKALHEDKIDIIATDHAPHTWDEKMRKYQDAPAGLPLVQHGLQILLDFYHQNILSLQTIVEKTTHNVAKRFQVKDRGFIREGYYADLVILDIDKKYEVTDENILYKCGWSPFLGKTFNSSIHMTICNGHIVFENGQVKEDIPLGMQIEFDR